MAHVSSSELIKTKYLDETNVDLEYITTNALISVGFQFAITTEDGVTWLYETEYVGLSILKEGLQFQLQHRFYSIINLKRATNFSATKLH